MFGDFREFLMRGNVVDLAVAVIIGAAFGSIVTSMVNDVLMPPIGVLSGGLDFKDHFIVMNAAKAEEVARTIGHPLTSLAEARARGVPVIAYGSFINSLINFLIIAFCIYMLVKATTKLRTPADASATKECPLCLSKIPLKATKCSGCTSAVA
ncbi:MAG: large conductance mechanosensitive channel protein MscL [Planctomycetes bacterium]|nr:large conductance mechanosensitive channel protein MscL [Planctomycetota bacterium]